jgi:RND superfamily putative drug exporter
MLAALTLLPALLALVGRAAFWPLVPRLDPADTERDAMPTTGVWARVPRFVARRARPIWIVSVLLLLAASAGLLQLRADGVPSSELVLGSPEGRTGQQLLSEHFPGGSGSPAYVLTDASRLQDATDAMLADDRFTSVAVTSDDSPSGSAPVDADGVQPLFPGAPAPEPAVHEGEVLLQGTLAVAADSAEAEDAVRELRGALFVFLVALGIDYNIFLMTRVREEALVVGARAGMTRGLAITGGVITSAGVVLAATFAALAVIPILFLLQLAFIVAFGVLLDTILVRSLLVPALGQELGRAMWWPSRRIRS